MIPAAISDFASATVDASAPASVLKNVFVLILNMATPMNAVPVPGAVARVVAAVAVVGIVASVSLFFFASRKLAAEFTE